MNEELYKRLDALASKLGVTAQYLWSILIKQARIELIIDIGTIVITICLIICTVKLWKYFINKDLNKYGEESQAIFYLTICIGLSVITVLFIIGSIIAISDIPTLIFNPQYWALTEILKTVK